MITIKPKLCTIALVMISFFVNAQPFALDTISLDEVVVTGSKVEVARKNLPLAVSVINRIEIENSDESNILPVISAQVPGVFVTQRGVTGFGVAAGAAGQINIRGLGGSPTTQALILIDGHPQFMGIMGHPLPDAYASSDVEKVEIIRGPASILYGSNAFGGVINIITRKQNTDGYSINARASFGSFNTLKTGLSGGIRKNGAFVFASVNHDQSEGHRDFSEFSLTNAYAKAGYDLNKLFKVYADISMALIESADPGILNSAPGDTIDIKRGKTSISLENNIGLFDGAIKFYYNFGEHNITDGWFSVDEMYGLMLYQGIKPFAGTTITLGYDFMEYGGKGSPVSTVLRNEEGIIIPGPTGPQFRISEYNNIWLSMQNHAFYADLRQELLGRLTINAGLRMETNEVFGNELIPQAGFAYNITGTATLKGSVSKGYRPPSIRELYLFPPANDQLKPENMVNYELSWLHQWMGNKINTEITAFICEGNNRIITIPLAPPPPPYYRNTGGFKNSGIEFSGKWKINKQFGVSSNYAFIHLKEPLPFTPEHNLFASANYSINKFNVYLSLQNISNLYNTNGNTIEVTERNYTVLGAKIKYRAAKHVDVYLAGNNLLNQDYEINPGYPMPKVNFSAGISFKLNKEF